MILCRFADQTAVQLPPQRRLIGMCFPGAAVDQITYRVPRNDGTDSVWEKLLRLSTGK